MTVFVDTSIWHAAAARDDASRDRAAARLEKFANRLVTTDHVLIETWYLAAHRLGPDVAERLVDGIRSGIARVENTLLADLEAAAAIRTGPPRPGLLDRGPQELVGDDPARGARGTHVRPGLRDLPVRPHACTRSRALGT